MATSTTPNPVSVSTISSWPLDTIVGRVGPIGVTYTTAPTTSMYVGATQYTPAIVASTAATNQFTQVTISRTVYAPLAPTAVTTFVGAQSTPVVVITQKASQPVVTTSVTQYGIAVPTVNTTQYDTQGNPYFILSKFNDIVSLPSQNVVADREN